MLRIFMIPRGHNINEGLRVAPELSLWGGVTRGKQEPVSQRPTCLASGCAAFCPTVISSTSATYERVLPVLAEAGVVDAGGSGYLLLLDAVLTVVDACAHEL